MSIIIKDSNIETAWTISNQIPEFDQPYPLKEYKKRLRNVCHNVLVAFVHEELVGFKIGYALDELSFYSWMGGVLPAYRNRGVATLLATHHERWASEKGFSFIRLKTRNIHKRMLIFALKSGFMIDGIDIRKDSEEHRIHLIKKL